MFDENRWLLRNGSTIKFQKPFNQPKENTMKAATLGRQLLKHPSATVTVNGMDCDGMHFIGEYHVDIRATGVNVPLEPNEIAMRLAKQMRSFGRHMSSSIADSTFQKAAEMVEQAFGLVKSEEKTQAPMSHEEDAVQYSPIGVGQAFYDLARLRAGNPPEETPRHPDGGSVDGEERELQKAVGGGSISPSEFVQWLGGLTVGTNGFAPNEEQWDAVMDEMARIVLP